MLPPHLLPVFNELQHDVDAFTYRLQLHREAVVTDVQTAQALCKEAASLNRRSLQLLRDIQRWQSRT